jgi:hypothetical protein
MQRPLSGDIFSMQGGSEGKVNILGGNSNGHCEKKKSNEYVSNSEWLSRESYLDLQIT